MIPIASVHSANILIVDDQQLNLTVLRHLLQGAGYSAVSTTTDARAVAALHRRHRYDLIVLDLNMPDMDGFEVLDGLRQIETGQYLPVLALSAEPAYESRALEAGAKEFICKPCDCGELLARVRNMLEVRQLYTGTRDHGLRLAGSDSLTGLSNRAQFCATLPQMLAAAWPQSSALLLIDLDGFTSLNDTLGRHAGDLVLGQFALRLGALAPPRACLSRLGDDEFALLLPALDSAHLAPDIAEAIRASLLQPFQLPGGELLLTAAIGIAVCPGDADEAPTLMRYADMALQQAKQVGTDNCCFYTDAMNAEAQHRRQLAQARHPACEQGQVELH